MKSKIINKILIVTFLFGTVAQFGAYGLAHAADSTRPIIFPVLGGANYTNDFGDPRTGGRTHEGNDLMGDKMRPLLAATDGVVSFLTVNEETWGWSLTIVDEDGYEYNYLHLNNDTPGTDDGKGGYNNAFASGIKRGSKVIQGQTIGFLGDSGNAETTAPHLHFEIRAPGSNEAINPYPSLQAAKILSAPVVNKNPKVVDVPSGSKNNSNNEVVNTVNDSKMPSEILPYDQFEGGANITSGNFDKDSDAEFLVGTAFGGGGRTIVKQFDTDGKLLKEFFAYGDVFRGGVDVASCDVDADGKSEIVTAPGPGGGPHIKIFKTDGSLVSEFMAYGSNFHGGVRVTCSDIDGDKQPEIITGPGATGGPHVKVFSTKGQLKKEVMAYSPGFTGGVDVASFEPSGKYPGGFVTSPGQGGGPHVKVFDKDAKLVSEFMAYPASFSGGVRISAGNFIQNNGSMEIVTVPASNSSANTKVFKTSGQSIKDSFTGFEDLWAGGLDAAIVGSQVYISSYGGRQTSIRKVKF